MPALISVARTGFVAGTVLGIHAKVLYRLKSADLSYPVWTFCAQTEATAKTKTKNMDVTAPGRILQVVIVLIGHPASRRVLNPPDSDKAVKFATRIFTGMVERT